MPSLSQPVFPILLSGSCRERNQAIPAFLLDTAGPGSYSAPQGPTLPPRGPWPTPFGSSLRLCPGKGCAVSCLDFSWCCPAPRLPRNPEPHTSGTPPFTSSLLGPVCSLLAPGQLRGDTTGGTARSPAAGAWVWQTAPVGDRPAAAGGRPEALGRWARPGPGGGDRLTPPLRTSVPTTWLTVWPV